MHIVILDAQTITKGDVSLDGLRQFGEVTVYPLSAYEEIADRVADADAVLCNKTCLDGYSLRKATHLRYIGLFATGYNNIDVAYTRANSITVCNAGSYSTEAVAQHTFGFILAHYSRVGEYNFFVQSGNWLNSPTFSPFAYDTDELYGKTIMPLEEMLPQADIVSIHCPLTPQTTGLINADTLRLFKPNAFLVNTARGAVVDSYALLEALEQGKLAGAGIDVLDKEPMEVGCPLLGAPNCIITPHVAWAPLTTRQRLMGIVEDNLRRFIDGKPINVVNG